MVLALVGRDMALEKLAEIDDNIVDVTSNMMSIVGIQNLESDHLAKVLEAQKCLETKIDELILPHATSRDGFSCHSMERRKNPLCQLPWKYGG